MLFVSGQIPLEAETGQLVSGGIREQTTQVLENLTAILKAAGLNRENVVKTTVYLADLADFAEFNRVYAQYFPQHPPARSTVQVSSLPKGARLEIEAIAIE
jgi:2-iminobutanoate/2-iminopropanoate deaminase